MVYLICFDDFMCVCADIQGVVKYKHIKRVIEQFQVSTDIGLPSQLPSRWVRILQEIIHVLYSIAVHIPVLFGQLYSTCKPMHACRTVGKVNLISYPFHTFSSSQHPSRNVIMSQFHSDLCS